MEEKNKAVVVKSVQRGSLAEVRPLGGAALAGAGRAGRLPPVPQGTSWNVPPHSLPMWGNSVQGCLVRLLLGELEQNPSAWGCPLSACATSPLCWPRGQVQEEGRRFLNQL